MKTLETARLILRPFQERDAADLFAYASLPDVGPNAGWKPHESIEESRKILRGFLEEDEVWALEDKISRKVIGSLGLHTDSGRSNPKSRMMGYCLSPAFWGKGLMPETAERALRFAFEDLELDLVWISHYPQNSRSKRVIEKLGFVYEGTLRQATRRYDGVVLDRMSYSMTREEWESRAQG